MAGLFLIAGGAQAADMGRPAPVVRAPVPAGPGFTFTASTYLWAAGLQGNVRTLPPFPAAKVNIGFDQVFENLNGALTGTFEFRYGRLIGFMDLNAVKLSSGKAINPAGYPGSVKLTSGSFTGIGAVGYRLVDDPLYALDGFAGIRGFALRNTLKLQVGPAVRGLDEPQEILAGPAYRELTESEQWVDAVVGARLRVNFSPSWHGVVTGFVGKGGSRYMWDVFGGIGYDFNQRWSAFAGYRAMKVDYRKGDFVYDVIQHGPMLGLQARF